MVRVIRWLRRACHYLPYEAELVFAWYDCWIGFYWDRNKRRLYFLPIPFFGMWMQFGPPDTEVRDGN